VKSRPGQRFKLRGVCRAEPSAMAMGCEQSTSVQLLALVDGDGRGVGR
jgi:hypothetical protein